MGETGTDWMRLLTLQDYNTRVVLVGVTLLGFGAGVMGTFMLLRKRAMMGDALAHATLPGIALAFILVSWLGGDGKSLVWLLTGAVATGVLGMGSVLAIRHGSRLKEDAALGIVLSVFFGLGVVGLSIAQQMSTGNAAGLESFIYGKTASMLARDAWLTAGASVVVAAGAGLLFKEFALVCFDQGYAAAQGWPVLRLDAIMMALVVLVTVIGLQAVGLILVVALLILPAAAARLARSAAWAAR
jgi:manganese/zinc/iron transport system permease protein